MSFEYRPSPTGIETDTLDNVCDRGAITDQIISPGGLDLADNEKVRLGTGNDAAIYYDNTDLIVDPKVVGTGILKVGGKGSFEDLDVDTLNLNSNIITDSTGTISFSTTNLSGSGSLDFDGLTIGATGGGSITDIKDEDNLVSDSQTALATQQSINTLIDSDKILFGTGNDAAIYYTGANLIIDPKEVGTGVVDLNGGSLETTGRATLSELVVDGNGLVANLPSYVDKVGVGTNTPEERLHVKQASGTVTLFENATSATGVAGAASFKIRNANNTVNNFGAICNFNSVNGFTAAIEFINVNHNTSGSATGDIRFVLNNAGAYGERIRITAAGDLKIVNDSKKLYFGAADDAYLEFDGNSLNIVANAVTGTDDLNLTADILNLDSHLTFANAKNIAFNTTTGTKIGTATTQKLSFYNATPVDQPVTVSDAATQDLTGADSVDQTKLEADLTSCKNAVNAVIDRLQELGLIA
jgi:hypothetical protein